VGGRDAAEAIATTHGGGPGVKPTAGDDPFDLPTRNDPNLRKLVERELELQKARRRDGG
jgi:hypothetical protein